MAATALLGACTNDNSSLLAPSASQSPFSNVGASATAQSANVWTGLASLPFARAYTVSAAANGKVYTIGGSDLKFLYNTVTEYNPASNTWATKAPMPKKINSQLGATVIGGLIFVPGGWSGSAYQSNLYVYDPIADSWSQRSPMPIPGACGGSVVINGLLYVAIGCDNSGVTGKLLKYDPATNIWTQLPGAPGTHSGGSVFMANNKLYWDNGTVATGIDVYNPATNAWTTAPSHITPRILAVTGVINGVPVSAGGYTFGTVLPTAEYMDEKGNRWAPRNNMVAAIGAGSVAVLNGELYLVGGNGPGSLNTVATVQKYTPGDYWLTASPISVARGYMATASAATVNNQVYAIGGRLTSSTSPVATHEMYNPTTGTWTTLAPLPSAVWGAAAAAVLGKIYVIGGFTGDTATTATNKVYEYDPASNTWTAKANAPTPIGYASAARVQNAIYVAVGTDGTSFDGRKVYRFDPTANSWSIMANSPGVHSQSVASGNGQYFITVGGGGSGTIGNDLNSFYVPSNSWQAGPGAPWSVVGATGGAIGSRVYLAMGKNGATVSAAVGVYDRTANTWSSRAPAPEALAFAGSAVTGTQVLTVGGVRQNGTFTNAARLYVP